MITDSSFLTFFYKQILKINDKKLNIEHNMFSFNNFIQLRKSIMNDNKQKSILHNLPHELLAKVIDFIDQKTHRDIHNTHNIHNIHNIHNKSDYFSIRTVIPDLMYDLTPRNEPLKLSFDIFESYSWIINLVNYDKHILALSESKRITNYSITGYDVRFGRTAIDSDSDNGNCDTFKRLHDFIRKIGDKVKILRLDLERLPFEISDMIKLFSNVSEIDCYNCPTYPNYKSMKDIEKLFDFPNLRKLSFNNRHNSLHLPLFDDIVLCDKYKIEKLNLSGVRMNSSNRRLLEAFSETLTELSINVGLFYEPPFLHTLHKLKKLEVHTCSSSYHELNSHNIFNDECEMLKKNGCVIEFKYDNILGDESNDNSDGKNILTQQRTMHPQILISSTFKIFSRYVGDFDGDDMNFLVGRDRPADQDIFDQKLHLENEKKMSHHTSNRKNEKLSRGEKNRAMKNHNKNYCRMKKHRYAKSFH
jgi:hypothetical protein